MRPREVGGLLRDTSIVKTVWVWVDINKYGGDYFQISKAKAREIVDVAKEDGYDVIRVLLEGDELYFGGHEEIEMESLAIDPNFGDEEEVDSLDEEEEEKDPDRWDEVR